MIRVFPVVLAVVLASVACTSGSDSMLAGVVTPPSTTTETFTGTVPVGGSDFHNFTVTNAGNITVTLTAAGPPPTIFMLLGVGTSSSSTCVFLTNGSTLAQAGTSAQLSGSIAAGSYCVQVQDAGNQTAPVSYSVTVVHP